MEVNDKQTHLEQCSLPSTVLLSTIKPRLHYIVRQENSHHSREPVSTILQSAVHQVFYIALGDERLRCGCFTWQNAILCVNQESKSLVRIHNRTSKTLFFQWCNLPTLPLLSGLTYTIRFHLDHCSYTWLPVSYSDTEIQFFLCSWIAIIFWTGCWVAISFIFCRRIASSTVAQPVVDPIKFIVTQVSVSYHGTFCAWEKMLKSAVRFIFGDFLYHLTV